MKKIFTLFAASLMSIGAWAQESVTATWTLGTKDFDGIEAVTSSNAITGVQSKGATVADGGTRTIQPSSGNIDMTTWKHVGAINNTDGYVEFKVIPSTGYNFKATKIDFDFAGAKWGNARADIVLYVGDESKNIKTGAVGQKGNQSTADASVNFHHSYSISGIASEEPSIIRLYIYSSNSGDTGTTREFNFANVVIMGEAEATGESREAAGIEWSESEISYKVRDNVPALPELLNPNNLDVTYTSTNADVAEVNEAGEIVLKNTKEGKAVITAAFEGNDSYRPGASTLTINVNTNRVVKKLVDPNIETLVPELDAIYKADKDSYPVGPLYEDENLTIIAHSETIDGKVSGEYAGHSFSKSIQVRVNSEPSDEDPYGDEYGDNDTEARKTTSLVVKPNVNLTLYVYGRRQTIEDESLYEEIDDVENNVITCNHYYSFKANDGKSLKFDDTDEPTVVLEKNVYLGDWVGTDYVFGISEIELEAGQEYNMYAIGTTYQVNGIGYIVPKDPNEVSYKNHVVALGTIDGKSSTDAAGYVVTRTGSNNIGKGNSTITVGGTDYNSIKVKGIITGNEQIVYTVAAPEGKVVTSATIYAIANSATPSDKLYFSKVANNTYTEETATLIESNDGKNPTAVAIDHIMLNSFDVELHSGLESSDDISMVVEVVTTDALHAPAAPTASVENEDVAEEIELAGSNKTIVITPAEDHHNVYYHFAEAVAAPAPAAVVARAEEADAPVAKFTVNGKEFSLVPAEGVVLSKAGTLSYFSHDPIKDIKSEIKTLSVTGDGATTGIENVAVDAAAAEIEYFNLQGIRVVNPENGVFIRRQGNEVQKVVL